MAVTEFGTNDVQTVKLWSKMLMREALQKCYFKRFSGKGENSIIQQISDLEKEAGDTVKYDLLLQMTGYGTSGDNPLEGFEEMMTYQQDSVLVDQRRIGHAFRRMSQQRTVHDLRVDAKSNLSDRWAAMFDELMIAQLSGAAGGLPADFAAHAGNTLVAPSGNYLQSAWTAETFTTNHLEKLVERAKRISPLIRPAIVDGEEYYCALVHTNCITDLRVNTSNNQWLEITKNVYSSKGDANPIFKGSVGVWNGVVIHATPRIQITTPGASQTARCLFLGAQAGVVAFANPYARFDRGGMGGDLAMRWFERERDYGNERGVGTGACFGMKPTNYGSSRFGMIAFDIKAADHN